MRTPDRDGFTIVELLVAAAISVIIVALLGFMFASLTKTTSRATATEDAFRDARAALHMMERDLSRTVAARPAAYFVLDADDAGKDASGTQFAATRQIEALISARNQPIPSSGSPTPAAGDLCAVRYYCGWDSNSRAYTLRRFFRDSFSTQQIFQKIFSTNGYVDSNNLYMTTGSADEPLAAYAWCLRATAYYPNGNIIGYTTDTGGYQTTSAPYTWDPSPTPTPTPTPNPTPATSPAPTPTPSPAAIEISFKAMSPAAARTVMAATANQSNAYTVWMAGDNPNATKADLQLYQQLIEPNTYVFRTRISLQ